MENLIIFLQTYLDAYLMGMIVLCGIFVTTYTKEITIIKDVYKVLIASIIVSLILYFSDISGHDLPKYLFTYVFTTSFYELFAKKLVNGMKKELK